MIELKGTTWNHPRGLGGVAATAAAYQACHPEVQITWHVRTLQDFADFSVNRLAQEFDLLVFDHPFIGARARSGCLVPLDQYLPADFLADQAAGSVGQSHASYACDGHQWALAIDAACHVSAYRPDLLARLDHEVPRTWDAVLQLARVALKHGLWIVIPLIPVDALMCIYSLCANAGEPPPPRYRPLCMWTAADNPAIAAHGWTSMLTRSLTTSFLTRWRRWIIPICAPVLQDT